MNKVIAKTVNDLFPIKEYSDLNLTIPMIARVPVDSETAKRMLERNVKNRRVRKNAVDYIKDQIIKGETINLQVTDGSTAGKLVPGTSVADTFVEDPEWVVMPMLLIYIAAKMK